MTSGKLIKKYREMRGLTQRELAEKCFLAPGTIQQYELEKRNPKIEQLIKIANVLEVSVEELFGDTRIDIMTEFDVAKIEYMINQNQYKSTSVQEDDKDIAKDLENIMSRLANNENGPLSYDGEEIPDEERELFAAQLEIMLRRLKTINKQKYNPNKNKPN